MNEIDIELMKSWKRNLLGIRDEVFDTHINTLAISIDRLPNPTKVEQKVGQVPVIGHRYIATHWPGKLVLRSLFKNNHRGPSGLTLNGTCLEIYPIPTGAV